MKVQLNTNLVPIFRGTYESFWEPTEQDDYGYELAIDYLHTDLMQSIANVYQEKQEYILSELNVPFIKSIKFLGTFYSPREYNFSTDVLDFEIEVNKSKMLDTLESLKDNKEFSTYLADNFTSYDGFWSYTPCTFDGIKNQIIDEGDEFEQSVSALITFLMPTETLNPKFEFYNSIEGQIFEYWQGNGYGGLDYTVDNGSLLSQSVDSNGEVKTRLNV